MKDSSQRAIIDLRQTLSQIIPWISKKEVPRVILARRPLQVPTDVSVKRQPAPALSVDDKSKSNLFLAQYKSEAMHAIRFPFLCCVLEGEVDIRLGIPSNQRKAINTYQVLTLPAQTFLLIPPGVFYPDGLQPLWERSPLPPANSKVFWVRILPSGAFCHTSSTRMGKHAADYNDIFVPDLQLAILVEMLMDELQLTEKDAVLAAQNALSLLLLRVQRGLGDGALAAAGQAWEPTRNEAERTLVTNSSIVDRACHYIRLHMDKSFSIKDVADHVHISPSYLSELFRTEIKTTVKKYALGQRLEIAESMLINTDISVQEIARFVGYKQAPQFNQVFRQIHHLSPTQFRRHSRIDSKSIGTTKE